MGSFDVITYHLLKKFKPKLSRLIIDTDKDWMGHVIKNLGTPVDPYDALRLIELNIHKSVIPLDHPDGSVTTEKIADGAITDAKVSSISRSKITDFWNTPFWDNIPDKPSVFPPEPHTHLRSEISDFWNTPFWNNIPDKPYLFKVITDLTVETNSDYVEWTNLDINLHGVYIIFVTIKNPQTGTMNLNILFNNDTKLSNYYSQLLYGSRTSVGASRENSPRIATLPAGYTVSGFILVILDVDGYGRALGLWNYYSVSSLGIHIYAVARAVADTNITSIRLQSSSSGGLGSGSRFILCEVKSS